MNGLFLATKKRKETQNKAPLLTLDRQMARLASEMCIDVLEV
jgi:hypothetical protein